MTTEATYWDKPSYQIMAGQLEDLLGKEKQLQAITDAWNSKFADGSVTVGDAVKAVFPKLAEAVETTIEETTV